MKAHVCFYVLVFVCCTEAYKVLLIYPFPLKSLNILGEAYVRHLTKAGHEVTFVTAFPKKETKNYRQIDISSNMKKIADETETTYTLKSIMGNEIPVNDVEMLQEYAVQNAKATLEDVNLRKLLEDTTQKFDVVIADLYESEVYAGLSALYNCPMIWSYSMGAHWLVLRLIDESTNPAYTADYLSSNVLPFSFKQRAEELWAQIKWTWIKRTKTMPKEKELYEETFKPLLEKRGEALPNYEELIYNASLIFANGHHAFGNLPSTPPNFRFVGGYHIEESTQPLTQELKTIMDNSKNGVIYFSMGSIWNSKDLPTSVIEGLVKEFGELKQTVIWKFEADLPNLPKNLKIVQWAPQQSILAHPNCLFFITHGGLLSSTEVIHSGIPVIGIPVFFDQFVNINKAVANGYAIKVPLNYDLPKNLKEAIHTMLVDKKYHQRAKELSAIYHDRLISPGSEVVHWVEHVVRTAGAPHLRSPALQVPFYQKMYLDLAAVIIVATVVLATALKQIFGLIRKSGGKKEKKN